MILYTVELEMDSALRDEYLAWLEGHVREMLALPGFTGAEILTRSEPPPPAGRFIVQAHYRLRDRAVWDGYLAHHAPAYARSRPGPFRRAGPRLARHPRIAVIRHRPRCFAQPRVTPPAFPFPATNGGAKTARASHLHEFKKKIYVMKFSPIRAPGRFREPSEALARRSSTTLSTATVDKRKTANGSLAYPAFLQIVATSRAN